jgi:3-phosphoshikimate 1-carboxyvinyltransferase
MIKEVLPVRNVNAVVQVPGSKSITNRALVCSALARGESVLHNASDSDDTGLMTNGLNQLGVLVRRESDSLYISGTGGKLHAPRFPIPVDNAGTTMRFLMSLAALAQGRVAFQADPRMAGRPNDDLFEALTSLGVVATQEGSRYFIEGGSFRGGHATLRADKSSQFLSSILLSAPYARENVSIEVDGIVSASYVDMTMRVMSSFGVSVQTHDTVSFSVSSGSRYVPGIYDVETDASGASYFLSAAAVAGGRVMVKGLRRKSMQGDIGIVPVLGHMGCEIVETAEGIECRSTGSLRGVDIDMNSMPDVVPVLAATALFADSPTRIRNIGQLRYKESDRIMALVTELQKLGARIAHQSDDLTVEPGLLHGAQLDTYEDHRLAMSFALIGLKVPGVKIENPQCVRKSFPTFWREFETLQRI